MTGSTDAPLSQLRDGRTAVWLALALLLLALAVLMHGVLPRYEFRVIESGQAVIIYDRWSGRFQRVNYDTAGTATLTNVVQPF
jgi:hypothetical protein